MSWASARIAASREYLLRLAQPAMKTASSVAAPAAKKYSIAASRSRATRVRPNGITARVKIENASSEIGARVWST
jgi:hypothetical protein